MKVAKFKEEDKGIIRKQLEQLNNLNSELTEVSDNLETLETKIEQKEEEISLTQQELEEAKKIEEWQYACMKERIKFMYERGDNAYLEIFFAADNFSDFLNKTDLCKFLPVDLCLCRCL